MRELLATVPPDELVEIVAHALAASALVCHLAESRVHMPAGYLTEVRALAEQMGRWRPA